MSDPQRHRLYEAQGVLDAHPIHFRSMEQMQSFVDKIVASEWWRERSDVTKVTVFLGRRDSSWAKAYPKGGSWRGKRIDRPFITVPPTWACTHRTMLHELAHVLAPDDGHGPTYAAAYVDIVEKFMGSLPAKRLRKNFDDHRVSYAVGDKAKTTRAALAEFDREQQIKSDMMKAAEAFMHIGRMA